jgi:hypothetical protein
MKYDWPSRNAATLAIASLTAYFAWRGHPGHLFDFMIVANILAIAVAFLFSERNLRRHLALLVSFLCIEAGVAFFDEFKCNPGSVCTGLSGVVFAVNIGALCFLLWPAQIARTEV